ncbi:MAG: YbbR-like domain-containing protein [Longimonas sp.]|uniref:CdaR family protein n=1 Tax=Longimonas sp. TaxID=2039626 RepID=UPI0039771440
MDSSDSTSSYPVFWERLKALFELRHGASTSDGTALSICVLIALVLWAALTLQEERTVTFDVPTELVNVPEEQALVAEPPRHVQVQVTGEVIQLLYLYANPPQAPIDASSSEVSVEEVLGLTGSNITIEAITPREIAVPLEPRVERAVPVDARVQVELDDGYELLNPPRLTPDSVTVSGAESIVESLDQWPTERQTIDGLQDSVQIQVPLADTLNPLVSRSVDNVSFEAQAGRFAEETRDLFVEVTGVPPGQNLVALEPPMVQVRYRVLFDEMFEARRADDFSAVVNYDQIRRDTTGRVEPRIHVPAGLTIRDPEPTPSQLRYFTLMSSE